MRLAHKIALDPTPEQAIYFARASGVARFAWNWALSTWQQEYAMWREYQCGPRPSEVSLRSAILTVIIIDSTCENPYTPFDLNE